MRSMEKSIRTLSNTDYSGRHIYGYAIVFDQPSRLLVDKALSSNSFREVIVKGAVSQEAIDNSNIVAVVNHNANAGVFAESNEGVGSLKLTIDDYGVKFEFDALDNNAGNILLNKIERGETVGCSFCYDAATAEFEKKVINDEEYIFVTKINDLYDVTIATETPAYSGTSVAKRTMEKTKEEILAEIEALKAKLDEIEKPAERTEESKENPEETKEEPKEAEIKEERTKGEEEKPAEEKNENKAVSEPSEVSKKEAEEPKEEENNKSANKVEDVKSERTIENSNINKMSEVIVNAEDQLFGATECGKKELTLNKQMRTLGTATNIKSTESAPAELALMPSNVLANLGANFMVTDKTNGSVPVYSPADAECLAETAEISAEGNGTVVDAFPHRISAREFYPRYMVEEGTANYEAVIIDGCMKKLYQKLEKMAFGLNAEAHTGSAPCVGGLPKVIGSISSAAGQTGTALSFDGITELISKLADANGDASVKILTNNVGKNKLNHLQRGTGDGLAVDHNEFDIVASGNVAEANIGSGTGSAAKNRPVAVIGDFSKMTVVQFGSISVDKRFIAERDAYQYVVTGRFDVVPTQPEAFKAIVLGSN